MTRGNHGGRRDNSGRKPIDKQMKGLTNRKKRFKKKKQKSSDFRKSQMRKASAQRLQRKKIAKLQNERWIASLDIGSQLDYGSQAPNPDLLGHIFWSEAEITGIDLSSSSSQFEITVPQGTFPSECIWIDASYPLIKPLHTRTLKTISLSPDLSQMNWQQIYEHNLFHQFTDNAFKVRMQMHHIHSSNESFITLYHSNDEETHMVTILSFDHQRNEFNKISDSLTFLSGIRPASVIDPANGIVHVFDWDYRATRHLQFDVGSKKWKQGDIPRVMNIGDQHDDAVFISDPINKIHIFSEAQQIEVADNVFEVVNTSLPFGDADVIYIESLQKLFAMNCRIHAEVYDDCHMTDCIYFCDVTTGEWEWKKLRCLKLPNYSEMKTCNGENEMVNVGHTEAIIANVGHLVFLFNYWEGEFVDSIYVMDLWTKKLWSTEIRFPMKLGGMRRGNGGDQGLLYEISPNKCVVIGEDEIHFFEKMEAKHYKISLKDVIPTTLIKYYSLLIHGYIRRIGCVNPLKDLVSEVSYHLIRFNM